jgi:heme-degrading monooxygenase HmoA
MIGRIWHGWTTREDADAYQDMLNADVLPGIHKIKGYRGAYVLRREDGDEVEFMTMTIFDDMAAVKQFAGEDYTKPIVQGLAQRLLRRADSRVTHYDIVVDPKTTARKEG